MATGFQEKRSREERGRTVLYAKQRPERTEIYYAKKWQASQEFMGQDQKKGQQEPLLWGSATVCSIEKKRRFLQRTGSITITRSCFSWRILSTSTSHGRETSSGTTNPRDFSVLTIMFWCCAGQTSWWRGAFCLICYTCIQKNWWAMWRSNAKSCNKNEINPLKNTA